MSILFFAVAGALVTAVVEGTQEKRQKEMKRKLANRKYAALARRT